MDDHDDSQQAFHADRLKLEESICDVIEKATRGEPLADKDITLLCYATGVDRRLIDVRR